MSRGLRALGVLPLFDSSMKPIPTVVQRLDEIAHVASGRVGLTTVMHQAGAIDV
jgi:hypothetical protein